MSISQKEERRIYDKELYEWQKKHKICTQCGHEKARKGHTTCYICAAEHNERMYERYHNNYLTEYKYHQKQYNNRKYDLLRAFGVCIKCKKRDAVSNRSMCAVCEAKDKIQKHNRKIAKGGFTREMYEYNGGCYFCGSPVIPGKKVCEKHYNINLANLEKAKGKQDLSNHLWKSDNTYIFMKTCNNGSS